MKINKNTNFLGKGDQVIGSHQKTKLKREKEGKNFFSPKRFGFSSQPAVHVIEPNRFEPGHH